MDCPNFNYQFSSGPLDVKKFYFRINVFGQIFFWTNFVRTYFWPHHLLSGKKWGLAYKGKINWFCNHFHPVSLLCQFPPGLDGISYLGVCYQLSLNRLLPVLNSIFKVKRDDILSTSQGVSLKEVLEGYCASYPACAKYGALSGFCPRYSKAGIHDLSNVVVCNYVGRVMTH